MLPVFRPIFDALKKDLDTPAPPGDTKGVD
jgi:hypothetical protein